jgi:hypothetical protein
MPIPPHAPARFSTTTDYYRMRLMAFSTGSLPAFSAGLEGRRTADLTLSCKNEND